MQSSLLKKNPCSSWVFSTSLSGTCKKRLNFFKKLKWWIQHPSQKKQLNQPIQSIALYATQEQNKKKYYVIPSSKTDEREAGFLFSHPPVACLESPLNHMELLDSLKQTLRHSQWNVPLKQRSQTENFSPKDFSSFKTWKTFDQASRCMFISSQDQQTLIIDPAVFDKERKQGFYGLERKPKSHIYLGQDSKDILKTIKHALALCEGYSK